MKKTIMSSVLLTGIAGVAAWQLHLGNEDVTGVTRSVDLSASEPAMQVINNQELVTKKPAQLSETQPQQDPSGTGALLNSDEETGELTEASKKFVASAKPDKIMEYYAQLRKARAELVQNKMNSEGSDPKWSEEINSRFEFMRGISPVLSSLKLTSTDCRQTICAVRMQLAQDEYKKLYPYMRNIGVAMGSDAFVYPEAGPNEAVIYLARADTTLPELDLAKD